MYIGFSSVPGVAPHVKTISTTPAWVGGQPALESEV